MSREEDATENVNQQNMERLDRRDSFEIARDDPPFERRTTREELTAVLAETDIWLKEHGATKVGEHHHQRATKYLNEAIFMDIIDSEGRPFTLTLEKKLYPEKPYRWLGWLHREHLAHYYFLQAGALETSEAWWAAYKGRVKSPRDSRSPTGPRRRNLPYSDRYRK